MVLVKQKLLALCLLALLSSPVFGAPSRGLRGVESEDADISESVSLDEEIDEEKDDERGLQQFFNNFGAAAGGYWNRLFNPGSAGNFYGQTNVVRPANFGAPRRRNPNNLVFRQPNIGFNGQGPYATTFRRNPNQNTAYGYAAYQYQPSAYTYDRARSYNYGRNGNFQGANYGGAYGGAYRGDFGFSDTDYVFGDSSYAYLGGVPNNQATQAYIYSF